MKNWMRNWITVVFLGTTIAHSQILSEPNRFRLEDGTPVRLRIQRTISSGDAVINEQVDFEVLDEVKVAGAVVIPKGGIAWGTITAAQPKRRMGRAGKLDINIDAVRLVNGDKAALRAVKNMSGGDHLGAMTGAIAATSLIAWPAAPFFLFIHGKDITVPKGTEITAYVNGDVDLDPLKIDVKVTDPNAFRNTARTALTSASMLERPAAPSPQVDRVRSDLSTVVLKSEPEGGEINVDGKFIGTSPSTVQLPPGDYTISMSKSGFRAWTRSLTITPGGLVTVSATLDSN